MRQLHQTLFALALAGVASTLAALVTAQQARPHGPCDIYAAAGTPCVTAHSTVRSLSSRYSGPLYQVKRADGRLLDRKSTRLNSSHLVISYAVFCLKKKKQTILTGKK